MLKTIENIWFAVNFKETKNKASSNSVAGNSVVSNGKVTNQISSTI